MGDLKIRLRFNPGREGSPMDKLAEFAAQSEKFLRSLAEDLGLAPKKGSWIAKNFTNESVAFDSQYSEYVDAPIALKARRALQELSGSEPLSACNNGLISHATASHFAKIGKALDADEFFYIGLYSEDDDDVVAEWRDVSHRKMSEIQTLLDAPFMTFGSVQGVIHAWVSGSNFFTLRESISGALVRCNYGADLYNKVHAAHNSPHTVVHVYGEVSWNRTTNSALYVSVKDIESSRALTDAEFARLFGSMPNFTGDLSTSDFIDWLRDNEEH